MSDNILNYVITASWKGKEDSRQAKQDLEGLGKTGITARNGLLELQAGLNIAQTALGAAGTVAREFYGTLKEGAQMELEREKFDALAGSINAVGDALLKDMQAATGGMVTNADLVRGATDLMNLGLVETADETVRWSRVVSGLNLDLQVLGLTLANDSTARLDSLGLSMKDVNSRTAEFVAKGHAAGEAFDMAVLAALEDKMKLFGDAAETTAGKLVILESSWANVTDRMKIGLAEGAAPAIASLDEEIKLWDQLNEARDRGIIGDQFWIRMLLAEGIPGREKFNKISEGYVSVLEYQIELEERQARNAAAQVAGYQTTIDAYGQLARNEEQAAYALQHLGWVQEEAYEGTVNGTAILEANRTQAAAARAEFDIYTGTMQSYADIVASGYGAAALAAEDSQARQEAANLGISESYKQTALDIFETQLAATIQEDGLGAAQSMIAYQEALGLITPEEAAKLEEVAIKTEAIKTATEGLFTTYNSDGVLTRQEMESMALAVERIDDGTVLMSQSIIDAHDEDLPRIIGLKDETQNLADELFSAADESGNLKNNLFGLPDRVDVDVYLNVHGSLPDLPSGGGGLPEPRAGGGGVMGGRPYLVGERGPELFVPSGGGQIVPNQGIMGDINFYITSSDPRQAADEVGIILARRARLNKAARI